MKAVRTDTGLEMEENKRWLCLKLEMYSDWAWCYQARDLLLLLFGEGFGGVANGNTGLLVVLGNALDAKMFIQLWDFGLWKGYGIYRCGNWSR